MTTLYPTSLRSMHVEYHILQSFPVSCLNRDDVGAPKTAQIGGVTRARVSSQCWKRQVRLALRDHGVTLATRSKHIAGLLAKACSALGADDQAALACGEKMGKQLSDDTLLFISESEAQALGVFAKERDFNADKIKDKDLEKFGKKALTPAADALDIALFGRMVAKASSMNVEAAASFAHALSTHQVSNEIDFFTALDDLDEDPGAAHMGALEFNAATYYRYVSLDLGQLSVQMGAEDLKKAVSAFTYALYQAVPSARQTTQSGACLWDFARVLVRKGQRIQAAFEAPIKAKGEGYLKPSIAALKEFLDKKERLSGSLFGKCGAYDFGEDENFSIDDLVTALQSHVSAE